MFELTRPVGEADAMTRKQGTTRVIDVKALLDDDGDYLRAMVRAIVEATLEAEMTAALGAEKGERTSERLGYRSGSYTRADHACRHAGAAGAAGRRRPVLDPAVRALPALGEGAGGRRWRRCTCRGFRRGR
jgi:Transposase, Mutator family